MRAILISAAFGLIVGCGSDSTTPESNGTVAPLLSISHPSNAPPEAEKGGRESGGRNSGGQSLESPAVRQLIQRANAAVVAGLHPLAVEALSQAIGLTPDDANLFRLRADVYVLQREMANARADYSTAVRLAPQNPELRNFRGYFLMSQGLSAEAADDFSEAVRLDPTFAAAWNNRGLISLAAEKFEESVGDFTRALELNRKFPDAWNNRGFARMKLGQSASALTDVQQALRLKEDYPTAWNNLGLIRMQMEDYAEAEKAFTRLIELSPMDGRWFNHRRAALLKQEKYIEARNDARQIEWLAGLSQLTRQTTARSSDPLAWISRGEYLLDNAQYGAAIQDFSRALQLSPGNTDALTGRAMAWMHTGELQRAVQDCDESIVASASPEAYSVRGDVWLNLKNYDQAVQDYELAQRFDGRVADAYELRARMHRDAGQSEKADADQQKAGEIRAALEQTSDQRAAAAQPPMEFPDSQNSPDSPDQAESSVAPDSPVASDSPVAPE